MFWSCQKCRTELQYIGKLSEWMSEWVSNSMEQSPQDIHSFSSSLEIPCILRKARVHFRIHKNPSLVPVLCQIIPFYKRILFIEGAFEYCPPVYPWIYQVVTFPQGFTTRVSVHPLPLIRATYPNNPRNVYRQHILRKYIIVQMSNEDN